MDQRRVRRLDHPRQQGHVPRRVRRPGGHPVHRGHVLHRHPRHHHAQRLQGAPQEDAAPSPPQPNVILRHDASGKNREQVCQGCGCLRPNFAAESEVMAQSVRHIHRHDHHNHDGHPLLHPRHHPRGRGLLLHPIILRDHIAAAEEAGVCGQVSDLLSLRRDHLGLQHNPSLPEGEGVQAPVRGEGGQQPGGLLSQY